MKRFVTVAAAMLLSLALLSGTAHAGTLYTMYDQSGNRCWGGADWSGSSSATVTNCVTLGINSTSVALVFNWSPEQLRIASPNGQTIAFWSDYNSGVRMNVYYPNGRSCTGRSFEAVPGTVSVTVTTSGYASIWQGVATNGAPECTQNGSYGSPPAPQPQQPTYAPQIVPPPYYAGLTTTTWSGAGTIIAVSGTNSVGYLNGSNVPFVGCMFVSAPAGGTAYNALSTWNGQQITLGNLPNLPLCSWNGMHMKTATWWSDFDGQARTQTANGPMVITGVQGAAVLLSNGTPCITGNCTVRQSTAQAIGGTVWYWEPDGSTVTPFTFQTPAQPALPPTVTPGVHTTTVL